MVQHNPILLVQCERPWLCRSEFSPHHWSPDSRKIASLCCSFKADFRYRRLKLNTEEHKETVHYSIVFKCLVCLIKL